MRRRPVAREHHAAGGVAEELSEPIVLPGIAINTGPADFHPIKQMRLVQFDGNAWQPIGDVIESAFASRPNDN